MAKEDGKKGANSTPFPEGKTRHVVLKLAGVSPLTLTKAEKVVEAAEKNPEKYGALLRKADSNATRSSFLAWIGFLFVM